MANPKVFISSTYYDLKHIRNDLQVFIQGLGYDAVMHDKGNIPYAQTETLEDSCYNEVSASDILICIIGNKYGTQGTDGNYSITMNELRRAISQRKKVYIYIVQEVYTENVTYIKNKGNGFDPAHVDDIRIHEFIEELKQTVKNHPILPFNNASDIIDNLRLQFAGLFQRLLSQEASITESKTFSDLQETANDIKALIADLTTEKDSFFSKFHGTIYAPNPLITHIQQLLGGKKYNIIVSSKNELCAYLNDLGFSISETGFPENDTINAVRDINNYRQTLSISLDLFSSDGLILEIRDRKILEKAITYSNTFIGNDDNDLPF